MRRWLAVVAVALVVLGVLGWLAVGPLVSPRFEAHVREALADYFGGRADLRGLQVTIFPRPVVTGEGFVLRHRGRTDIPPLVQVERFSASATWSGLLKRPRRVEVVRLDGLRIHIPTRRPGEPLVPETLGSESSPAAPSTPAAPHPASRHTSRETPVIIDRIETPGARLEIAPKDPAKPVRLFDIHALALRSVGLDRPMGFAATLTNPKPPGPIEAAGEFGPFDSSEPSETPVRGTYTLTGADLGVFKGIAGKLTSRGSFTGVLERIEVDGRTSTPDFRVALAGNPVPLETTFSAVVDGTNGNTFLVPVNASFLGSSLTARGGVYLKEGLRGRQVSLDVVIDKARIEDLLRLAIKGATPIMTGAARITTTLVIPPGEEDVIDKLQLDGEFKIASARFSNVDVQRTLARLSARGRGRRIDAEGGSSVVSNLSGRFRLRDGRLSFSRLTFSLPGVSVNLRGTYTLRAEQLHFRGTLRMQARISQTVTGFKSALLKVVDPLFRKNGAGAEIPIKVEGERRKPKFGMDFGALLPGKN